MIVIGLGSNIGARDAMLDEAVAMLRPLMSGMKISSRVETPALLMPNSPPEWDKPFLNMAVVGECNIAPQALLVRLKQIEQQLGRQDRGRWAPREIDLDILAYNNLVIREVDLHVPHPGLLTRYFALAPFAEVAPDWKWPIPGEHHGKTARALLTELFP